MANPYRKSLLISLLARTFTLPDTLSFPRRDNALNKRPPVRLIVWLLTNKLFSNEEYADVIILCNCVFPKLSRLLAAHPFA